MSTKSKFYGEGYWRSLQQRELTHDEAADSWREFADDVEAQPQPDPSIVPPAGLSRRRFFSTVGASAALAGVTGCVRKPVENIMPFAERPEDLIPGKPLLYATAVQFGSHVEGVLVESQDGRPTKIEGNPKHPGSNGATSVWTQATVRDLYDPERTRVPLDGTGRTEITAGETHGASDWATARAELRKLFDKLATQGGAGLGIVTRFIASPTQRAQLAALRERFPQVRVFTSDGFVSWNGMAGAELVGRQGARAFHSLDKTAVVFAADCDFLHTEPDSVRMQREWARTRKIVGSTDFMSRLYVVEPHFTTPESWPTPASHQGQAGRPPDGPAPAGTSRKTSL